MTKRAANTKTSTKKRLVLLDAHAIIHRAYHALPEFTSSKGEPTGGLYGLSLMLLKIAAELRPDYLIACFDLPEPTYRHEAFEEYKAGRVKADDALVAQIEGSRDVFKAFGIPAYECAGFEADDLLGTIVEGLSKEKDIEIVIASGDMDTLQLVSGKRVRVYTLKKGIQDTVIYDEKAVEARFGFGPERIPDFKGLRGDPSDNIPGIKGVGEKTASALITAFGSIAGLYRALKKDAEALEKAGIKGKIAETIRAGQEAAEFSKMLATIRRDAPISFTLPESPWSLETHRTSILELFDKLEFRSLARRFSGATGASLKEADEQEPQEVVDAAELAEAGLALWIIDSNFTNPDLEDILRFTKKKEFAAAKEAVFAELEKRGLRHVYDDIEHPLIEVVEGMERRGILVDATYLAKLSATYHKELSKLEEQVIALAGKPFNLNSPKQLGDVLFDTLGLAAKNQKKTGTGQRSTKESELEKIRDAHPIVPLILEYREVQKLLSTYLDTIPPALDESGRLHARFLQTGTTTGRMSSQSPNLQNIPIRTERGRTIRHAFIATPGFELLSLDYSQIELRVAAVLSGDEKLTRIFKEGGDVHAAVAAEVFGVAPEQVDREMRRRAKVINFGILYGMGVNALRANLGTDRAEAQAFYNEYFKNFSGLAAYLDRVKADAARKGYTETLFGRRRYFEGIRSSIPFVRASAERMAINAPIQGTQADVIKIAMVRVGEYVKREALTDDVFLLLQVHDELVYEVREPLVARTAEAIREIMESVLPPSKTNGIVFKAEASRGKNWGELQKIDR